MMRQIALAFAIMPIFVSGCGGNSESGDGSNVPTEQPGTTAAADPRPIPSPGTASVRCDFEKVAKFLDSICAGSSTFWPDRSSWSGPWTEWILQDDGTGKTYAGDGYYTLVKQGDDQWEGASGFCSEGVCGDSWFGFTIRGGQLFSGTSHTSRLTSLTILECSSFHLKFKAIDTSGNTEFESIESMQLTPDDHFVQDILTERDGKKISTSHFVGERTRR